MAARLQVLEKAARASHAEATHESSKAENKYDTRGLEAAYLAGVARLVRPRSHYRRDAIEYYESMIARDFAPQEPIDMSAVVELDTDGSRSAYFIGPRSGGLQLNYRRKEIMAVK